jgi:DNA-binding protein HU-beta
LRINISVSGVNSHVGGWSMLKMAIILDTSFDSLYKRRGGLYFRHFRFDGVGERRNDMTKAELVSRIAEEAGISKKAAGAALASVVSAVHEVLKKAQKIRVTDLGSFSVVKRQARQGVNPRTGKPIKIPATKAPKFTAAKALKDAVKK